MRAETKPRRSLPLESWPSQDRRAWLDALRPAGLFEPATSAADWSEPTRKMMQVSYGTWLAWLERQGLLDAACSPAARASSGRICEFITELKAEMASASVAMVVGRVKRALEVIDPKQDFSWLRPVYRNLKRAVVPVKQKHTRIVSPTVLFDLGLKLFCTADEVRGDPMFAATQARDGLMIALLAARPIRLRNFSMIEIGQHLAKDGNLYRLTFGRAETKTGRPIDGHCPAGLTEYIDRYLANYRETLLARSKERANTRRFWINRTGAPMAASAIRAQILGQTKKALGRSINPHLFRDCVATTIAEEDPEHVRIATAILGHTRVSTTDRHYNQAQMLTAGRAFSQEIIAMRRNLRGRARRAKRGLQLIAVKF